MHDLTAPAFPAPALDGPRTSELASAYLAADYRWEHDGEWRWLRIGVPAPEIDSAFPEFTRFTLLSAWNPHSLERPESDNRFVDVALKSQLSASPYAFRAAFSSAPDRSWREPSWLVAGIPVEPLDDLGRRFGQLGTLYWQRGEPIRLRMYAAPPAGFESHPDIDWLD